MNKKKTLSEKVEERFKECTQFWPMEFKSRDWWKNTYPKKAVHYDEWPAGGVDFNKSHDWAIEVNKLAENMKHSERQAFTKGNWEADIARLRTQQQPKEEGVQHGGPDHIYYNAMEILESKKDYKILIVVDFTMDLEKFINRCSEGTLPCDIINNDRIFFHNSGNVISFKHSSGVGVFDNNVFDRVMFIHITGNERNKINNYFIQPKQPTKEIDMNQIATISQEEAKNKIVEAVNASLGSLQVGALANVVKESNELKASYKIMEEDLKLSRKERNESNEQLREQHSENYKLEKRLEGADEREVALDQREASVTAREAKLEAKFQVKDQQITGLKEQVKLLKSVVNRLTNPSKNPIE